MPVIAGSVKEARPPEGSIDKDWNRTYRRVIHLEVDDPDDGPIVARAGCGVAIGNSYASGNDSDAGSFATSIQANCISDDFRRWEVVVEYGQFPVTDKSEADAIAEAEDPLDARLTWSWRSENDSENIHNDINGDPITNSAGDYFEEGVERDKTRAVMMVDRNESTFNPNYAKSLVNKLNSDVFGSFAVRSVKVRSITAQKELYHPVIGYYWKVHYEFEIDDTGLWVKQELDRGFRKKTGANREVIVIDNTPVSSPVPLNGSGGVLTPGNDFVTLEFDVYESTSFATAFNFVDVP